MLHRFLSWQIYYSGNVAILIYFIFVKNLMLEYKFSIGNLLDITSKYRIVAI
jgi:hypothetical protein